MSSSTLCLHRLRIRTPLGELLALASDQGLCALEFPRRDGPALHERLQRRLQRWFPPHDIADCETPVLARTRDWLSGYFDGVSADLPPRGDLPLDLRGAPFERRGRWSDEAIGVMRTCWRDERSVFHGEFFDLEDALVLPAPAIPTPIVVGGRSDAAARRAGRLGDGWLGIWNSPRRFAEVGDRKSTVSHRGQAFRALRAYLER